MKEAHIVLGALALFLCSGCAGFDKKVKHNVDRPHPMESRLGHIMFNIAPSYYPVLRQAGVKLVKVKKAGTRVAKAKNTKATRSKRLVRVRPATAPLKRVKKMRVPTQQPNQAKVPTRERELPAKPVASAPTPLDITAVPTVKPVTKGITGKSQTHSSSFLATAKRLEGIQSEDYQGSGFLIHLLQENGTSFTSDNDNFVKAFYEELNTQDRVFGPNHDARPGDLVFFHNTHDRDKDARADDWFTQVGVVVRVDGDRTVHFISYARGQIRRMTMNLERPSIRRNEASGRTINSLLRSKKLTDRPFTSYLSGELFAAYARVENTSH